MHNVKTYKSALLAGLLGCSAILAQDEDPDNPATLSPGEVKVSESLASQFEEFAGENALPLIEALRTGGDLSYDVETQVDVEVPVLDADGNQVFQTDADGNQVLDGSGNPIPETTIETQTITETVVVENTVGAMGFGNAKISMLLAEELLSQEGLEGTMENISGALFGTDPELADGILELRADGGGWGKITKDVLGTNLGSLMSQKNTNGKAGGKPVEPTDAAAATTQRSGRPADTGRAPKESGSNPKGSAKPKPTGRSSASASSARPARASSPGRANRPSKPTKPARLSRAERPSRPDRPSRPSRPEKPNKPNRPGR